MLSNADMWAKIVVPTYNSAAWISSLVEAYRRAGLAPIYLVDDRSNDRTFEVIQAASGTVRLVQLSEARVETLIPELQKLVGPGWVCRIDDDEFPSGGLIEWLREAASDLQEDSFAVQRRWVCIAKEGHLSRLHCRLWIDSTGEVGGDHQWRIFHTERVPYKTDIHTPGFVPVRWSKAPAKAYLVHFDWVLRSEAERLAKIARYDLQAERAGSKHWMYYLPEQLPPISMSWLPMGTSEFDELATAMRDAGRRPKRLLARLLRALCQCPSKNMLSLVRRL